MPRRKAKPLSLPDDDGELVRSALRQILGDAKTTTTERLKAIALFTQWQVAQGKMKGQDDDNDGHFFGG